MGDSREHYIGDEILEGLRRLSDESDEFDLAGRHPSEVDFTAVYHGYNYLYIEEHETDA